MNASFIPSLCGGALLLMCGAGVSHFTSVRQQAAQHAATAQRKPAVEIVAKRPVEALPVTPLATPPPVATVPAVAATPSSDPALKELTQDLISELRKISRENQNLRDQVAETNRDLMEMQFRLDTHSQSFRPLQNAESEPASQLNNSPVGVLPPLDGSFSEQ